MHGLSRISALVSVSLLALTTFANAGEQGVLQEHKGARYDTYSANAEYPTNYIFAMTKPKESKELAFEDGFLNIQFFPTKEHIGFILFNKTDDPIRIDWDQVSYVDVSRESHRVVHSGVKYIDRNKSQVPTLVPPTAKIQDIVFPSDYVHYDSGESGGWSKDPLFPEAPLSSMYKGRSFSIFMPLEVHGDVKNYLFSFKIEDVSRTITQPMTSLGRAYVSRQYIGTPQAKSMTIGAAQSKAKTNLLQKLRHLRLPDGIRVVDAIDLSNWQTIERIVDRESMVTNKQYFSDGSIEVTLTLPRNAVDEIMGILMSEPREE